MAFTYLDEPVRYNEGKVDWTLLPWDNTLFWWLNDQFTQPPITNQNSQRKKLVSLLQEGEVKDVLVYSLLLACTVDELEREYPLNSINIPWNALEDVCRVFTYGCIKYSRDNYKLAPGLPLDTYIQSMWRHLIQYLRGEEIDNESKLPHLSHLACNAFMYLWTQKEYHTK